MGLKAKAPRGMREAVGYSCPGARIKLGTVHRLQIEVLKIQIFKGRRINPILGKDDLQFITTLKIQRSPRLWTHADPVNARWRRPRTIRFDRYGATYGVKCAHQVIVYLKKRLSSGADDERASVRALLGPLLSNRCGKIFGALKPGATRTIGSNEVSIAEAAYSLGAIPLKA